MRVKGPGRTSARRDRRWPHGQNPPLALTFPRDKPVGCVLQRALVFYQSRVASSRRQPPQTANPDLLGGLGPEEKFVRLLDEHPYQIEPTCKGA